MNNESYQCVSSIIEAPSATLRSSAHDALVDSLWTELADGRYVIQAAAHTATHCEIEVTPCSAPLRRDPRSLRDLEYLRRLLVGVASKEVAIVTGRAASTIASATGGSLARMGLKRGLLYVPYVLVRAAHVASGLELPPCRLVSSSAGSAIRVSVERPDIHLQGLLSPSECEVVGLMLEGNCNEAIAQRRKVSPRTVANQISAVFTKLKISGRMQLFCKLVEQEREHWMRGPIARFVLRAGARNDGFSSALAVSEARELSRSSATCAVARSACYP